MDQQQIQRGRRVDRSNAQARSVVDSTLTQFARWRDELATFEARARRRLTEAERGDMLARCGEIETEVLTVRTELILSLAEAPQRVRSNSHVVDVERALDSVERSLGDVRGRLGA